MSRDNKASVPRGKDMGRTQVDAFMENAGRREPCVTEAYIPKTSSGNRREASMDHNMARVGPGKWPRTEPRVQQPAPGMPQSAHGFEGLLSPKLRIPVKGDRISFPKAQIGLLVVARHREKPSFPRAMVKALKKFSHQAATVYHISRGYQAIIFGMKIDFF